MLMGDKAVGALTIRRSEVKPFTDKEIKLVETFAAQAVIAIENTRLLNELRQRTRFDESLEQQTATSEVLKIISSFDRASFETGFRCVLENAARLCEADTVCPVRRQGTCLSILKRHSAAARIRRVRGEAPGGFRQARRQFGRLVESQESRPYSPTLAAEESSIPMLKSDEAGRLRVRFLACRCSGKANCWAALPSSAQEVRPFTDKQIELVQTFAAQPSSPSRIPGCSMNCASALLI